MNEIIDNCNLSIISNGLWDIFSTFNGNPEFSHQANNYGIRFGIGMFFSLFLFIIIKMRALITMKRHHIIAMISALLFFISYLMMFGFEWGYQIGLYKDPIVHFLSPPIEHFFYMMAVLCMAYYSLNHFNYYPGLLKRFIYVIPISITAFFIYATLEWKEFFIVSENIVSQYKDCGVDWQSHLILTIISAYLVFVSLLKCDSRNHFISAFWTITFIEHFTRTICFYNNFEPSWLHTIFHAIQIWSLPIITLHFIKTYIIKLGYCELCKRHTSIPSI